MSPGSAQEHTSDQQAHAEDQEPQAAEEERPEQRRSPLEDQPFARVLDDSHDTPPDIDHRPDSVVFRTICQDCIALVMQGESRRDRRRRR